MEVQIIRAKKTENTDKQLRVCAYCRVSTDKSDQANSLEAQKRFFKSEFARNTNWIDCGIYADEGTSGTTLEKRDAFNEMIERAYNGEIDLIITKEVGRFSRNLKDTVTITDELIKRHVYIKFLSDDLITSNPEDRDRLDQLALSAQQESKRTSKRVRWGHQRCMENGVVFGRREMYGYNIKREDNGKQTFEIIDDEAEIVKRIFLWYAESDGTHVIAKRLEQMGVKSKWKKGWSNTVILRILRQEKYVGDLIQGKTYTPDPMTHKKKYNRGDAEMYYIKNHHPDAAIIDRDLWDRVQKRLIENAPPDEVKAKHNNRYWLSGKVFCGVCGGRYVSFTKKQVKTPYKAWVCFANHQRGARKEITNDLGERITVGCDGKRVNERVLTIGLYDILTLYLHERKDFIRKENNERIEKLRDQKPNVKELQKLKTKLDTLNKRNIKLLDVLLDGTITREEYNYKHNEIAVQIEDVRRKISDIESETSKNDEIKTLIERQKLAEELSKLKETEIGETLFARVTEKIIVHPNNILEYHIRFLPGPVFLRYETVGKGNTFNVKFEIISG